MEDYNLLLRLVGLIINHTNDKFILDKLVEIENYLHLKENSEIETHIHVSIKPEKPLILRKKESGEYYDWVDEIFEDFD